MAIAVVTGSSTGIGLATAATLARAGHTVYATMRNPKTGGEELRATAEHEHLPLRITALDVDSDESVKTTFGNIISEAGRIDVLVNNAGIGGGGAVEETPIARILRDDGNQLLWCVALHSRRGAGHERKSLRLHRQHHVGCRQVFLGAPGRLRVFKVCA